MCYEKSKDQIVFDEAKENLRSSKRNSDSLDRKVSNLSTLCVAAIGILSSAVVLSKVAPLYEVGLLVLLIGFIHALAKLLKSQETAVYASSAVDAQTIYKDENYEANNESDLLATLSVTHDEMAEHNRNLSGLIAEGFDGGLIVIQKYAVGSALVFIMASCFSIFYR